MWTCWWLRRIRRPGGSGGSCRSSHRLCGCSSSSSSLKSGRKPERWSAGLLITADKIDPATAAFHAPQAAEKYRKALLVRHQIPFPKTHDLAALLRLLAPREIGIGTALANAPALAPFAVEFRYPGERLVRRASGEALPISQHVQAVGLHRLQPSWSAGPPAANAPERNPVPSHDRRASNPMQSRSIEPLALHNFFFAGRPLRLFRFQLLLRKGVLGRVGLFHFA